MDALIRARTLIRQQTDTDPSVDEDDMPKHCEATAESEISEISEITQETGDLMHKWRCDLAQKGMGGCPIPPVPPAVHQLHEWLTTGALDTLPERIPGFAGELVQYSARARLIGLVRAILDAAPWSLTAQDRAVQFVIVLTPLIEGGAA